MKKLLLASCLGAAMMFGASADNGAIADTAPITGGKTEVKVKMKGSLLMMPVAKTFVIMTYDESDYDVRVDLRTSGVGALLKKDEALWAESRGTFVDGRPVPDFYVHQNLNEKARRVEVDYQDTDVKVSVNPRFGSMGTPPASREDKLESLDPLTGIANMIVAGQLVDAEPCSETVPLFDGKQRYNFRYEKLGTVNYRQDGFKREALKCHIYYDPVSGFDPEDLEDEDAYSTPLTITIGQHEKSGLWIPLKLEYPIGGFDAVVRASDVWVTQVD